jgi:hypothetical protein
MVEEEDEPVPDEEEVKQPRLSMKTLSLNTCSRIKVLEKRFITNLRRRVKNNRVKRYVVEEVIKTEEGYMNGLGILLDWRSKCLSEAFITEEEANNLFLNIETIYGINSKLLVDL